VEERVQKKERSGRRKEGGEKSKEMGVPKNCSGRMKGFFLLGAPVAGVKRKEESRARYSTAAQEVVLGQNVALLLTAEKEQRGHGIKKYSPKKGEAIRR